MTRHLVNTTTELVLAGQLVFAKTSAKRPRARMNNPHLASVRKLRLACAGGDVCFSERKKKGKWQKSANDLYLVRDIVKQTVAEMVVRWMIAALTGRDGSTSGVGD